MKTMIIAGALTLLIASCAAQEKQPTPAHGRTKYEVVDTTGFYLYKAQQLVPQIKGYPHYATAYFFSTDNANIQPLTIPNLKKAFPSVPAFHYALDAHFRSNEELTAWDPYQKIYKVKYLYLHSK
jgi:hypothetical protein